MNQEYATLTTVFDPDHAVRFNGEPTAFWPVRCPTCGNTTGLEAGHQVDDQTLLVAFDCPSGHAFGVEFMRACDGFTVARAVLNLTPGERLSGGG